MIPVRPAVTRDLDAMVALLRDLSPEDPAPDPDAARRAWAALLGSGIATVLLAEAEGVPAATCTLLVVPNLSRGVRPYAVIENVVTLAAHRRRGLGHAVMEEAIRRALAAGCYKIMLATGSRQAATLRFYESLGFVGGGKTHFELRP